MAVQDNEPSTGVAPDWAFQVFARLADEHPEGAVMSMTLYTSGGVVAGDLIGEVRWARLLHEGWADLDQAARFAPAFARAAEILEEGGRDQDDPDVGVEYIHLENARFLAGREWLSTGFGLWRGKVRDVTGWSFGYERVNLKVNMVEPLPVEQLAPR